MEAIKALLKQITAFWAGKDKRFKRNAILIASSALVVIIIVSVLVNQVEYATLYSGLDSTDSTAVLTALTAQKVPYRVSGSTILVPAEDADSLRMSLSAEVKSGFNLDILKQGQGLGLTESDKQDYRRYQIQVQLQNDIKTLDGVKDAKVILTMPAQGVLVLDSGRQDATAGIILTLADGVELNASQAMTIKQHVQKGVPGLKLENISLMNNNMQSLDFSEAGDSGASAQDRYTLQAQVQTRLKNQVMDLLRPIFGYGRVEAQVGVTLDFDSRTVDSVKFEPVVDNKNGIVVSIDRLKEQIINGTSGTGEPGTAANTGTATYPVVNAENGTYDKTAEKINYEINSIKESIVKEKGAIKDLSVSVVIDNTNLKDDYTDNVKNLVATAVGVSRDLITVEYLPMASAQAIADSIKNDAEPTGAAGQGSQNLLYIALGVGALLLIVVVVLLAGRRKAPQAVPVQYVDRSTGQPVPGDYEQMTAEEEEEEANRLADIKIVKDSGTKEQIGKLIDRNPELVANLLRSWLADEQE